MEERTLDLVDAGDEIAAGWKLDSIDASAGLVTLRHTSGQTWVLQLNPDLEK